MFFSTLSGRFLGLAIIFVIVAEILIFLPSVARFRETYLMNRLDMAQLATLALLATPDEAVAPELNAELLETAHVLNVVLQRDDIRELVLSSDMPTLVEETFNLRKAGGLTLVKDAIAVFFQEKDRVIRVIGNTMGGSGAAIEVTLHEAPLRLAMIDYGKRVFYLSLAISVATAAVLFFAVRIFMVQPINRVIDNMVAFRDNPEDASQIISPSNGALELKQAERALHDLEVRLSKSLRQKERLATLGGAVARISHDLRNMLTTAQLLVDGIGSSADPIVQKTAPKLVNSITRAANLCERTLTFGKAEEPVPSLSQFALEPVLWEVVDGETPHVDPDMVTFWVGIPKGLEIHADQDQLFRVLSNLVRNAAQAIQSNGSPGDIYIEAKSIEDGIAIIVRDTGPGLPENARENLFQPFRGGVRKGGMGLGLAIASEIIRGHGGVLSLEQSDETGTTFKMTLPNAGL